MSLDAELWVLLISAAAAVVPWAFSLHAKVAVIAASVEHLPELVEELHRTILNHEHRLNTHEQEIKALKDSSGSGY